MKIPKEKPSSGKTRRHDKLNKNVARSCKNYKYSIAILTKKTYIINGFYTRLIEITRQNFRLENQRLRHVSGIFFKLDLSNYRTAKQFLDEGAL